MEEDSAHNEASDEENNILQLAVLNTERQVPSNDMQVGGVDKLLGQFLTLSVERVSMKKERKEHWVVFVWSEVHSYLPKKTI